MDILSLQNDDMPVILPDDGTVEQYDPRSLQAHPLNAQLYGEEAGDDLRASIAVQGILSPLLITQERVIISGHRRHAVALELGLKTVPVTVSPLTDTIEIEEALIRANISRTKTKCQRAREYQKLKPIQTEMAQRRKLSGQGTDDQCINLYTGRPAGEKGRASDIAAKMIGWKGLTADRALQVVQAIDDARDKGCDNDADLLITRLNKSIIGSHKLAKALGYLIDAPSQTMSPLKTPEWAKWEWNPVTGCQGECARVLQPATRFDSSGIR